MALSKFHHQESREQLLELLIDYHNSGKYDEDLNRAGELAIDHIKNMTCAEIEVKSPAITLDIDETTLSNDWNLVNPANPYNADSWDKWVAQACAPAIPKTLELFDLAKERNIDIFFITGRHPEQKQITEDNLTKSGYQGWNEIFTEPRFSEKNQFLVFPEAATYKTAARWSLIQRGYRILLNMGDQYSDIKGDFADMTVKLPNPFYFIV
ncbi:MAG: HAD family acid phosphatase [Calothrix sp. MO_192.B10]|nr:HAD family acid phosphatase [Calothrix sp. MO_192.B10]